MGFSAGLMTIFFAILSPRNRAYHLTIICTLSRAYHTMSEVDFSQKNHELSTVFRQCAQKYFSSPVHLFLNFVHLLSHFSTVT